MARPSKYDRTIPPNLDKIIEWLSEGVPERDIAKNLNIGYTTWRNWKQSKSEFKAIFDNIVTKPKVETLENKMFKLAEGYNVTITKAVKCKEVYYDDLGRRCEREVIKEYDETIYVAPNFNALRFLLCNWSENYSNDPALMRQRAAEFEHKKKIDEENNW